MKFYKIGEFASKVGKSSKTIREWDKLGLLKPHHTGQGGYRYYSEEQIKDILNINKNKRYFIDNKKNKKCVLYCVGETMNEAHDRMHIMLSYLNNDFENFEIIRDTKDYKNLDALTSGIIGGDISLVFLYDENDLSNEANILFKSICDKFNCEIKYMF